MKAYQDALGRVLLAQKDYAAAHAEVQAVEGQLEEIRQEEDRLRGEIVELEGEIQAFTARLAALEKVLKDLGAEKLQARIAEIVGRLRELPEARDLAMRRAVQAEAVARSSGEALTRARLLPLPGGVRGCALPHHAGRGLRRRGRAQHAGDVQPRGEPGLQPL